MNYLAKLSKQIKIFLDVGMMSRLSLFLISFWIGCMIGTITNAQVNKQNDSEYGPLDKAPESILYDWPRYVAPGIWSAIGATQPPTYENSGHNNNLTIIEGSNQVLVVNAGASFKLAEALHQWIDKNIGKPVTYVVNENGQGHAMLGNNYWRTKKATIIAHEDAIEAFNDDAFGILQRMQNYAKEKSKGTEIVDIDIEFSDEMILDLGGREIILKDFGPAHSPGDISVIVPDAQVIIAGDMAFHERMLPIFSDTHTGDWLESFEHFAEYGKSMIVVPGHGRPTQMDVVDQYTRGYLIFLRSKVAALLDEGKGLSDAFLIDQSQYEHLHTYKELSAKNAGRVFEEMEFE